MDAQQTKIYTALFLSALIIGSIILYFIISIVRQQRRNLELHRLNILTEINTLEKERTRMAADLHDELGPTLSAIRFKVESIDTVDEEDKELLRKTACQIDETITRVREIAANLMPAALTRGGLVKGIEEFISKLVHPTLQISFSHQISKDIPLEKSVNIYRMLQEIIQNTIKHAHASKLYIQLEEKNDCLHIICEDNGIGFDYKKLSQQSEGLGLRNLKSRTQILGGTMQVYSEINKGSQFKFSIPV